MCAAMLDDKRLAEEFQDVPLNNSSDDPGQDIVIMMIGKTGHGKSKTGNTILGFDHFPTSDLGESLTQQINVAWIRRKNSVLKVVDGPGIGDTRKKPATDVDSFIYEMGQGFEECLEGFHALALVLRYGVRFTEEEQETIRKLKVIFGKTFIKDHGVIVFTHGEGFDMEYGEGKTFEQWCETQKGMLKDVILECQNRVVLFRNSRVTSNEVKIEAARTLFELIKRIPNRYTHTMFDQQRTEREKLIVELGAPEFREEMRRKINLLLSSLKVARKAKEIFGTSQENIIQIAKQDAIDLQAEIKRIDRNTDVMKDLKLLIQTLLACLETADLKDLSVNVHELVKVNERLENERRSYFQRFKEWAVRMWKTIVG